MIHTGKPQTSRRQFLSTGAKILTATTLLSSLPKSWVGNVYAATDTPEVTDIKFGIIALTDCAPFVIAFEKGFFKKYGINATITKGASWAAIRDNLCSGDIQATHMLLGMPLASTMGLAGSPKKSIVVPWIINLNGQGITLDAKYKSLNIKNALDLKPIAAKATAEGKPLSFAMTFPPGTHAMWLRYWLGMGGINPDKDLSLIHI